MLSAIFAGAGHIATAAVETHVPWAEIAVVVATLWLTGVTAWCAAVTSKAARKEAGNLMAQTEEEHRHAEWQQEEENRHKERLAELKMNTRIDTGTPGVE